MVDIVTTLFLILSIPIVLIGWLFLRYYNEKQRLAHIPWFNEDCGTAIPSIRASMPNGFISTIAAVKEKNGKGFAPVVRRGLDFTGGCGLFVTHPDAVREVLTKDDIFAKSAMMKTLADIIGENIVCSSGEHWKMQRRLLTPVFHFGPLKQMIPDFASEGQKMVDRISSANGQPIDIFDLFTEVTMGVIIKSGFGSEFDVDYMATQWKSLNHYLAPVIISQAILGQSISRMLPFQFKLKFDEALNNTKDRILESIKRRRQEGKFDGSDLLSLMLKVQRDGNLGDFSDELILGECMIFLLAGQDTTASTLNWCTFYLGQNPDLMAKLQAEVDSVLGTRTPVEADLKDLVYTKQVIEESLRIRSPVPALDKVATCDTELMGYHIPKGTKITVGLGILGMNENMFPDPEKFDPDRFATRQQSHPFAYVPFSAGNRNCIGQKFAIQEAMILLAMIAQNFDVFVEKDVKFVYKMEATLMPMGATAKFTPRRTAQ